MDFFEAQEAARRRTSLLIALFLAAVAAIIAVIYAVVHIGMGPGAGPIDPLLLGQVALLTGLVIAAGSGFRIASLRSGGPAVAELLGGRRVSGDTTDAGERMLLNVVEEMALASGTPVPAVYVLEGEDGINAFAAGYAPHDAAVAMTRGALDTLTRDELQGVVAHEFSHILNGDMRLNVRLIGVLYGILLLAVIGRGILYSGHGGRRNSRDGGGGAILLVGLALLLVGYIGVFFGKLIKAAVSRQREYLADSAAVEFTRNPEGLAGALKKIGAEAEGSRVRNVHAEELSHLFFANGVGRSLAGMLSTHPPLQDRIRRLQPAWAGDFPDASPRRGRDEARYGAAAAAHGFEAVSAAAPPAGRAAAATPAAAAEGLVASVGAPTPEHLRHAARFLARLPDEVARAAHEPTGARALILALLLPEDGSNTAALDATPEQLAAHAHDLAPAVTALGRDARLPLLDLALPALQGLSPAEGAHFLDTVRGAVAAGGAGLFEFTLLHALTRHLDGPDRDDRRAAWTGSFRSLAEETATLLSAVAWAGSGGSPASAAAALAAGAATLPPGTPTPRLRDRGGVSLDRLDESLRAFAHARPAIRRDLLRACAATAAHDHTLVRAEAELLRGIADALDCPMPPLLG